MALKREIYNFDDRFSMKLSLSSPNENGVYNTCPVIHCFDGCNIFVAKTECGYIGGYHLDIYNSGTLHSPWINDNKSFNSINELCKFYLMKAKFWFEQNEAHKQVKLVNELYKKTQFIQLSLFDEFS